MYEATGEVIFLRISHDPSQLTGQNGVCIKCGLDQIESINQSIVQWINADRSINRINQSIDRSMNQCESINQSNQSINQLITSIAQQSPKLFIQNWTFSMLLFTVAVEAVQKIHYFRQTMGLNQEEIKNAKKPVHFWMSWVATCSTRKIFQPKRKKPYCFWSPNRITKKWKNKTKKCPISSSNNYTRKKTAPVISFNIMQTNSSHQRDIRGQSQQSFGEESLRTPEG